MQFPLIAVSPHDAHLTSLLQGYGHVALVVCVQFRSVFNQGSSRQTAHVPPVTQSSSWPQGQPALPRSSGTAAGGGAGLRHQEARSAGLAMQPRTPAEAPAPARQARQHAQRRTHHRCSHRRPSASVLGILVWRPPADTDSIVITWLTLQAPRENLWQEDVL